MSPCQYKHNTGFNVVVHLWTGVVVVFCVFGNIKGIFKFVFHSVRLSGGSDVCVQAEKKKSQIKQLHTHTHCTTQSIYHRSVTTKN